MNKLVSNCSRSTKKIKKRTQNGYALKNAFFYYKIGLKMRFLSKMWAQNLTKAIYIYMLWSYYLVQVWPFEGLLSGPSRGYYLVQTRNKKREKTRKSKKYSKMSFSVISQNFSSFGWVSKISPFWQLGPKSAHPQNTIKIGFQQTSFWKEHMRHETAIFGPKTKSRNSSYHSFCLFSSLSTTKTQKILKIQFL